jgi:hypothetical protein
MPPRGGRNDLMPASEEQHDAGAVHEPVSLCATKRSTDPGGRAGRLRGRAGEARLVGEQRSILCACYDAPMSKPAEDPFVGALADLCDEASRRGPAETPESWLAHDGAGRGADVLKLLRSDPLIAKNWHYGNFLWRLAELARGTSPTPGSVGFSKKRRTGLRVMRRKLAHFFAYFVPGGRLLTLKSESLWLGSSWQPTQCSSFRSVPLDARCQAISATSP